MNDVLGFDTVLASGLLTRLITYVMGLSPPVDGPADRGHILSTANTEWRSVFRLPSYFLRGNYGYRWQK